jgi:hypothetical protein
MIEPEWTNDVTVSDKEELRDTVEFFHEVVQAVRGKLARGGREIPGYLMLNPDFQTLEIPRLVVRAHLMKRVIRMPNRNPEAQRGGESPLPGEDLLPVLRGLLRSNDFEHLRRCGIPLSIVANLRRERRKQILKMTRIIRTGWHIEPDSLAAQCRALDGAIPTPFAFSAGNQLKSLKAWRFHLLSHLLDGADVAALRRSGAPAIARYRRRSNAWLFWKLVTTFQVDLRTSKEHLLTLLRNSTQWKHLEPVIVYELKGRWEILRLRIAAVLYRVQLPVAQEITLSSLERLLAVFEGMERLSVDLLGRVN